MPENREVLPRLKTLQLLQGHVGGCREWVEEKANNCWRPAEFVLWGKLIPAEGLGPRCYDHAAEHVGHGALSARSDYALVNLTDLARDVDDLIIEASRERLQNLVRALDA